MGVKLVSASGGSVEINPPATASNFVATMPAGTGTVAVNGVSGTLVSGTAVASTSGTSIDFTGIPSWVKRITVMFNGVSTNGSSGYQVQLGNGAIVSTGYTSSIARVYSTTSVSTSTSGFFMNWDNAAFVASGAMILTLVSANTWVASGTISSVASTPLAMVIGGNVTLSSALDRVRITTANGTDIFDAGAINILYE